MRDMVAMSIVLAGFTSYLSSGLNPDVVYGERDISQLNRRCAVCLLKTVRTLGNDAEMKWETKQCNAV